ncbi:MAG: hypothetical protein DHS20C11_15680 [Lysobacteraceae bacterium]|nr:MAG: hypothetical protein DHS20C11_15680 [Xanthomonadaceae bacterium]
MLLRRRLSLVILAFAAPVAVAGGQVCFDPLLFRTAFEVTPSCAVDDQPLSELQSLLEPDEPVQGCIPPGSNSGLDYCQGTCAVGGSGCDVEFSTSDVVINVSDDLVCFDALIALPAVDISALGFPVCSMRLDIVGSNMAALDGTYSAAYTWQYASSLSDFVVDDVLVEGCDAIADQLDAIIAGLTPDFEAQGAATADALLATMAGVNFCPVDSLHPDFIGGP